MVLIIQFIWIVLFSQFFLAFSGLSIYFGFYFFILLSAFILFLSTCLLALSIMGLYRRM